MHFQLSLAEEQVKPHQVTTLHLIAAFTLAGMGGLCFVLPAGSTGRPVDNDTSRIAGTALMVTGVLLLGVALFRNRWLLRAHVNRIFRAGELAVVLGLTACWLLLQYWMPAVITGLLSGALVFALYWEQQGQRQARYITVDPDGIRLPGIGRGRLLGWPEVERVLLRFGVLTVDCYDNHLFQWNIRQADFDKETFETWCAQQIADGKRKRNHADDW